MSLPVAPDGNRFEALRDEIAGFKALIKVLAAEAEALRRADADALSVLSASKMEQVAALQGFARARGQELKRLGIPENAVGIRQWLTHAGDVASAQADWLQLTQLALEAKRQNEVNGRLAARQRWHFDAALGALLQAAGVSSVYGADGRTRRTTVSQAHLAV